MAITKQKTSWQVIIPEWENHYVLSKKSKPKYWLWKDKEKLPKKYKDQLVDYPLTIRSKSYCRNASGEMFIKNSKSVGKPKVWVINGQQLYSGNMYPQTRAKITEYFHKYFSEYIKQQIPTNIIVGLSNNSYLSISCDIYEIRRGQMPDIGNMWPLIKWFEDALQDCNIIPDDNPDYVIESGRKRYYWVDKPEDRKLIFNIEII